MKGVFFVFGALNDQDIEWLMLAGKKQHVDPGVTLVQEGVPTDKIYLVLEGDFGLKVALRGPGEIARIGVGEVVGEISFIDARAPSGTVTARTPAIVLSIPILALAAKIRDDIPFAARFYRALSIMLAYRLRAHTARQESISSSHYEPSEQLDMNLLDNVHLAGARFQRILSRMNSS